MKLKEFVKKEIKIACKELILIPRGTKYSGEYKFHHQSVHHIDYDVYGTDSFLLKINCIFECIINERKKELLKLKNNKIISELEDIAINYACNKSPNKEQELVENINNLLKIKKYINILPVYNLETANIVEIGNCTIYPSINDLIEKSNCLKQLKEGTRNFIINQIRENIKNKAINEKIPYFEHLNYNLTSEGSLEATHLSFDEIAKIINFFNYRKPEYTINRSHQVGFNIDCLNSSFGFHSSNPSYEYTPADLQELINDDVFRTLLNKYNSKRKSDLDRKIIDSIIWVGDSFSDYNIDLKFLKVISAFEILLLNNMRTGITEKISKNIAYLMYDDFKNRFECYEFIKNCYDIRSKIIHNGFSDDANHILTKKVIDLHKELIKKILLEYKFKDYNELADHINLKEFS